MATTTEQFKNKKAFFDYEILDSVEAGIVLLGEEVKSIRTGGLNFAGSYILFKGNVPYLVGVHISHYRFSGNKEYNPTRDRILLVKKNELEKLKANLHNKGVTLVPLSGYFKHHLFKISIGLARGKKNYDKRESIKQRDLDREMKKNKKY